MSTESLETKRYWLHQQRNGAIAFIALSILFVVLKLTTPLFQRRTNKQPGQLAWSGWQTSLCCAALAAFLPLCACNIVYTHAYLAYYTNKSQKGRKEDTVLLYKASYGLSVAYPLACALPKLSVCFLYLSVFSIKPTIRYLCWTVIAFLIANTTAWEVPSIVVCRPISEYWNMNQVTRHCIDVNTFGTWISLPHVISDLVMFAIPVGGLWNLQRSFKRRILVLVIMLTGCAGIVGACVRLGFYVHRTYIEKPGTSQSTKSIAIEDIVGYVEAGMYLIASCLPSLGPILRAIEQVYTVIGTRISSRGQSGHATDVTSSPMGSSPEKHLAGKDSFELFAVASAQNRRTGYDSHV